MKRNEPQTFNEAMQNLRDSVDRLVINAVRGMVYTLESSVELMPVAVVDGTSLYVLHSMLEQLDAQQTGIVDAPAVEFRRNGKSYDEHGCEITPTLPLQVYRRIGQGIQPH